MISHIVVILNLTPLHSYPQVNAVLIFHFVTGCITYHMRTRPPTMPMTMLWNALQCCNNWLQYCSHCKNCLQWITNPHIMMISHIVVILNLTPLHSYPQVNAVLIFHFVTGCITYHMRTRPPTMPMTMLWNALQCCNNWLQYCSHCKHCLQWITINFHCIYCNTL